MCTRPSATNSMLTKKDTLKPFPYGSKYVIFIYLPKICTIITIFPQTQVPNYWVHACALWVHRSVFIQARCAQLSMRPGHVIEALFEFVPSNLTDSSALRTRDNQIACLSGCACKQTLHVQRHIISLSKLEHISLDPQVMRGPSRPQNLTICPLYPKPKI